MIILEARKLTKVYSIEQRPIHVLRGINLQVSAGEFLVIAGASGSGKTTLLSLLSGLDHPTSGQVFIERQDITDAGEADLAPLRNQTMGFVFQSFHLAPSMTAIENIMFPAQLAGDKHAKAKAMDLIDQVGMQARAHNFPSQLSGGEKQRIALCRAMINHPKLLFADEPTGNLDAENGAKVLAQLLSLRKTRGATLILVTHNPAIAQAADRVVTLSDGYLNDIETWQ